MSSAFQLDHKHALITGGTRGIGLEIARGFLAAGAKVTICSRRQEHVAAAIEELNEDARLHGVVAHVGRPEDIERLVLSAEEQFGTVNVLINNAGTNPFFGPIIESNLEAWDKTMEVNVRGPYLLSKRCAVKMASSGGGVIINIASVAGLSSFPMQGIYSVSKAALIMLTKVMAKELGGQGVRVNCICPGLIKTRLSEAIWSDPNLEAAATSMKALGRIGNPAELVGAAIYLASDASSFTTGAVLQVDGGMII